MNRKYEAVVIFEPSLSDEAVQGELEKIKATVESHEGSILMTDIWGKRPMAYKIQKHGYGIYVLMIIEGNRVLVADLDRQLKIDENVLRHLVVLKDKHAPDMSPKARDFDSEREPRGGREGGRDRGDRDNWRGDRGDRNRERETPAPAAAEAPAVEAAATPAPAAEETAEKAETGAA